MFRKIVLPLDLTDKHQAAVNHAADLAGQSGGEVILLHVIEMIPGLGMDEEREFYERLERSARKHLERYGAMLTRRRVPWQSEIRFGSRPAEIRRFADETQASLIVLTCPPFDPHNLAAGWGSLSWKLAPVAPCPVLLVK